MKEHPAIEEIAGLANLHTEGMDLERLTAEFERILEFLAQLEEVAAGDRDPRFGAVTEAHRVAVLRADQLRASLPADEAVAESPSEADDHQFRVPPVIE